jgi:hypothetical protein
VIAIIHYAPFPEATTSDCGKNRISSDVEVIAMMYANETWDRVIKGDV